MDTHSKRVSVFPIQANYLHSRGAAEAAASSSLFSSTSRGAPGKIPNKLYLIKRQSNFRLVSSSIQGAAAAEASSCKHLKAVIIMVRHCQPPPPARARRKVA